MPFDAARICADAAGLLTVALEKQTDSYTRSRLAGDLSLVATRLDPVQAAYLLIRALEKESDTYTRLCLAEDLASAALRLSPPEAEKLLTHVFKNATNTKSRQDYAKVFAALVGRLDRQTAIRVSAAVARSLMQVMGEEPPFFRRRWWAEGLIAVTGQMESANAAELCTRATQLQIRAMNQQFDVSKETCLSLLVRSLEGENAARTARAFARRLVSDRDWDAAEMDGSMLVGSSRPSNLGQFVTIATRQHVQPRATAVATLVGTAATSPLAALPFLPAASEPLPCRLDTQDLVEMLKFPTCVGEVRRVILDQLGNRYHQRFVTHWDFVRYAQDHNLNLDFTTPPQRPDAKLPPLFED